MDVDAHVVGKRLDVVANQCLDRRFESGRAGCLDCGAKEIKAARRPCDDSGRAMADVLIVRVPRMIGEPLEPVGCDRDGSTKSHRL